MTKNLACCSVETEDRDRMVANGGTSPMARNSCKCLYIARLISFLAYGLIFVDQIHTTVYGLIFVDRFHTMKSTKFNTPRKFLRIRYSW